MKIKTIALFLILFTSCQEPSLFEQEFCQKIATLDSTFLYGRTIENHYSRELMALDYLEETTGIQSQLRLGTYFFYIEYKEDRKKWLRWLQKNKHKYTTQ